MAENKTGIVGVPGDTKGALGATSRPFFYAGLGSVCVVRAGLPLWGVCAGCDAVGLVFVGCGPVWAAVTLFGAFVPAVTLFGLSLLVVALCGLFWTGLALFGADCF